MIWGIARWTGDESLSLARRHLAEVERLASGPPHSGSLDQWSVITSMGREYNHNLLKSGQFGRCIS